MKCIDTSVLIEAGHNEALKEKLRREEVVIPALAAAEFLAGIRLVKSHHYARHAQDHFDDDRNKSTTVGHVCPQRAGWSSIFRLFAAVRTLKRELQLPARWDRRALPSLTFEVEITFSV